MELIDKIGKYAFELGYTFLVRTGESGDWFIHFFRTEPIEQDYAGSTKVWTITDDFIRVHTNAPYDTLLWAINKIENELMIGVNV